MTTKTTSPLTDAQKAVLASGKALAKELGLTEVTFKKPLTHDVELTVGQIALVVTPERITLGTIEETGYELVKHRAVQYQLKDVFQFRKDYTRTFSKEDNSETEVPWVPTSKPKLYLPPKGKLYVT
jgi:hypothetical protein